MAKKHFGKIAVLAALAGAAVGISYFLRYKSFNEELEEDFHDFEDDLDEFDTDSNEDSPVRNYVSLNPEAAEASDIDTESADSLSANTPKGETGAEIDDLDSDVEFLDDDTLFPEDTESVSDSPCMDDSEENSQTDKE